MNCISYLERVARQITAIITVTFSRVYFVEALAQVARLPHNARVSDVPDLLLRRHGVTGFRLAASHRLTTRLAMTKTSTT